ncbi:pro-cathepsin H-like isoform X1 [Pectinophora gossypiella]|uniref:pro-cathepsin H-like isoform X1 n=1 Tax=Pectinophora gossypiella TaxID=13191 RepID=UPI00214F3192|nr:pro-cathepsin H-like isoform X1 [Pectinophora gossypiella]
MMKTLVGLLVLAAIVDVSYGYALAPAIEWPAEYHFNAEEVNLGTGIMKPFEIWYSTKYNKSRIDLYGGTISRYYYGVYYDENDKMHTGKIYMIHPEVADDDSETVIKCDRVSNYGDQKDFLPPLEDFTYSGNQEHDGKQVQVWTKEYTDEDSLKHVDTVLLTEIEDEIAIPLHHYQKAYNLQDGSLQGDVVINYYNYNNKFPPNTFDVTNCDSWNEFPHDFEEAVKYLHPTIASDVDLAFHRFKLHHDRNYEDHEHEMRQTIFRNNWHLIVDTNSQNLGYTLALNQFADKTPAELAYLNGVMTSDPIREGTHPFPHTLEEIEDMVNNMPKNFDLRDYGVISPVRNQAHCGSCWAFAAAATMEGVLARANGGRVMDLSEQSLVDCAWAFKSHGCQGTRAIDAVYEYLLKHGIPTVREYGPYLEEDGYCNINNMTEVYRISGFVGVTSNSPNALKAAVYKYGPVTVGVLVTQKMWFYKSGVLYDMECVPGPMNHAVTLIGYGERDGDLYWLIKNSWGEIWGQSGYLLLSAKNDNCNTMHCPFYPII